MDITKIYRDWMKKEITRPELAREKKDFISAHFGEGVPGLSAGTLMPALALLIFCFILIKVQPIIRQPAPYNDRHPEERSDEGSQTQILRFAQNDESMIPQDDAERLQDHETFSRPAVEVKRLTSKVGTTMVYQKSYQDQLITIVWVFVP